MALTDKKAEQFDTYLRAIQRIAEVTKNQDLLPRVRQAFGRSQHFAHLLVSTENPDFIELELKHLLEADCFYLRISS
jgi:hypothetical protein